MFSLFMLSALVTGVVAGTGLIAGGVYAYEQFKQKGGSNE
jgi:hypothetical protein